MTGAMRFVVHALDRANASDRRMAALEAHRRHLDTAPARHGVRVLLSGPLTDDAGARMVGSFFLLEAPGRAAVEALFAEDPLVQADVWETRQVHAVRIRQNAMTAG